MISPDHRLIFCRDAKELSLKGAQFFQDCAARSINEKGSFIVALAGGSTPKALYYLLSKDDFKERINWNSIHFYFGDERAVSPNDMESNFRMASQMLFNKISLPQSNIHRIKGELGKDAAPLYSDELIKTIKNKKGGIPLFDLIILGVGSDGHTASLFPGTESLFEKEKMVTAVHVEKLNSTRITLTTPLIQAARNVLILVSGKKKALILKKLSEEENSPSIYPIELVNDCEGEVTWLIDEEAASKMHR